MSGDKETELLGPRPRVVLDTGAPLPPGTVAGSWRIDSLIAVGGCGTVYAAHHGVLDRPAAVKVLHAELAANPSMVERFVQEARAVNQIRHPNIVDIFDFGTLADGRPFFAMELLARDNLEDRLDSGGRMTLPEVLAIIDPICLALSAAHRAGYVHRDLKARNIGFAADASGAEHPRLLDFGIAKLLEEPDGPGSTGTLRVGTPHCMSPEQIRGERVDARTDVYALGVLLYHLVTGTYPFDSDDSVEVERLHLEAPPPLPSRLAPLPTEVDALVTHAMAKEPAVRPASAADVATALRAAIAVIDARAGAAGG